MAVRRILTIDNTADLGILKQVSRPVDTVDADVRVLMDDMLETMYDAPGIGLAAVQIGDLRRVVVMDLGDGPAPADEAEAVSESEAGTEAGTEDSARHPNPRFFVNPEILWASDELYIYEEGCLSIPEYFDQVERPARVRVAYLDREGVRIEEEIEGLYAVCFQHELDHLNGVLFIDHLSRLRRDRAMTKVKKIMRTREAA
ncbi:peptide deformylase [Brevundimonas variabilis]|uniref:Peptide deformylase n=1 Tax=Brevundimonas variabilis TaxID=74312 RepID=A0A7W9FFF7_9CAUL|nr:peptide deformylase [Brevundimonas variabilis]MBB5747431.1 peptide deformylase [Brevundimonas variabilis]